MPTQLPPIHSYVPYRDAKWEAERTDGSGKALIYAHYGVVSFFTFPGNDHHRAFTTLEMYWEGRMYHTTLENKHYQPRWWRRLANAFACQIARERQ